MAGGSTAGNCSVSMLRQCYSKVRCPDDYMATFYKGMGGRMWRVNALLLVSTVLAGVIVGIGGYGQRYRHHPFTRFIFIGATTLFVPIISYLVPTISNHDYHINEYDSYGPARTLTSLCGGTFHPTVVNICAYLVQIIVINTSVVVASDDREGRNRAPPLDLLVQAAWIFCLTCILPWGEAYIYSISSLLPFMVICAKMVLKYHAYGNARQSVALGRNPRLVFGYMQQLRLREESQHSAPTVGGDAPPPPLLVMGEEQRYIQKQPHGYMFKDGSGTTNTGLVTIDRIWQFDSVPPTPASQNPGLVIIDRFQQLDSVLPTQASQRLCLSFALFKLLRCRFARYNLPDAGSKATLNFFWSSFLKDGQYDRTFAVIEDELSFLHDYYYSSLPISYSKCWVPILGICISLSSIGCILILIYLEKVVWGLGYKVVTPVYNRQISCWVQCTERRLVSKPQVAYFGWAYFDMVPAVFLLALVLVAEVRDIASYICSNWTKVTLICHSTNISSRHSVSLRKWIGLLLQFRCKLMKHWDGKMDQCSVLTFHPRAFPVVLLHRVLRLPDQKTKVKVPTAVKVCIIDTLRSCNSNERQLSNGTSSLNRSQVGESFMWACNSKGTSDVILIWHIATCILEVKYPHGSVNEQGTQSLSDNKIAATHLSRYCAYLVAWYPELLPDDDSWSKSLYNDVKKEADRLLHADGATAASSSTPEDEYRKLVALLGEPSNHEVLKSGVKLGKQLAELMEGEETAWKLLAGFWAEMILYVAPSDNLKGHSEAIARGGELITLLWAMLFHVGIVNRPTVAGGGTAPVACAV